MRISNYPFIFVIPNNKKMKNQEVKSKRVDYSKALAVVMPRNNGTQAGINALTASLKRGISK